jgi:hypothetical protein
LRALPNLNLPALLSGTGYPLRPELMESTFMLHAATGDPHLLSVGAALHQRLRDRNRVACGYASVGDVSTGQLEVGLWVEGLACLGDSAEPFLAICLFCVRCY